MKTSLLFFAFALCAFAHQSMAQKTYKWVDDKGVVNYGPMPPDWERAAKVNTAPALTMRYPGAFMSGNYYAESDSAWIYRTQAERYRSEQQARQEQVAAAQEQHRNRLIAECERNRGTDCKNPDTLRYIENLSVPYARRY